MNFLESFLSGKMEASQFLTHWKTDSILRNEINAMVLKDAKNCPDHGIWKLYNYDALKEYDFDLTNYLESICRLDGSAADNLNLFSGLMAFYRYSHPNFVFTKKYEDIFNLYLDVIQDCFDGPEVENTVKTILYAFNGEKNKKERLKETRDAVKQAFHCEGRIRPRWVQGPEWPMGDKTPMKFVRQIRAGEQVQYVFTDIDTGETRIVEQYY